MIECTWNNRVTGKCTEEATHPQLDAEGNEWATLCDTHHKLLEDAIINGDVPKMLSYWVLAHGGAATLAKKMI